MTDKVLKRHSEVLADYGLKKFAELRICDELRSDLRFTDIEVSSECGAVYAWLIDGELLRIGSCKSSLQARIRHASRWCEARLRDEFRIKDKNRRLKEKADAERWKSRLHQTGKIAEVWGRRGSIIDTPLGKINAYLAEENVLLERFRPPLNNSSFR